MPGAHDRNLRHLFITGRASDIRFTNPPAKGGGGPSFPRHERVAHATKLLRELTAIQQQELTDRQHRSARGLSTEHGIIVEFAAESPFPLAAESLARRQHGITLLNIRSLPVPQPNGEVREEEFATVRVPFGKLEIFEKLVADYRDEFTRTPGSTTPQNEPLVASIGSIRRAAFEAFWTSPHTPLPDATLPYTWEAWVLAGESEEERAAYLGRFRDAALSNGLRLLGHPLNLPETTIHLLRATRQQLEDCVALLDCLSELRAPAVGAAEFDDMEPVEQSAYVHATVDNLESPPPDAPAVCLLDTGLNHGHPLLAPVTAPNGLHSHLPAWGTDDRHEQGRGHGTQMGGLAAYGDLTSTLLATTTVHATHWIESAKIFNDADPQPEEQWGNISRETVAAVEQAAPFRRRVFAQQITARESVIFGQPTSWSAATDLLCAASGEDPAQPRLLFISAGNYVCEFADRYPAINADWPIRDPAQAWNAVTVGAFTDKDLVRSTAHSTKPVRAPRGGLSPMSSTSVAWEQDWPIKPDIVLEGGNRFVESDKLWKHPDLEVLTTNANFTQSLLTTADGTSAASAQAARLAAILQREYPDAWPETLRALLVHSAEWTHAMKQGRNLGTKGDVLNLLRHYGHGVPDLLRALRTARSAVTLVVQDEFQPFIKEDGDIKTNVLRLHSLPWPKAALEALGAANVELRVTLSYFIEPNPGTRLTNDRYRYGSCHLRFEIQRPHESEEDFRQRINFRERPKVGYVAPRSGDSAEWLIGSDNRHRGSLHQDTWRGSAADLGSKSKIAVYPVSGWWRLRPPLKRYEKTLRYALVVSLRSPEQPVDLYTPIATELGLPTDIKAPVPVALSI
jgi:hypothetical protein